MTNAKNRSILAGLRVGLESFVTPRTPSAKDLTKARQLRAEAAHLRSVVARVRQLKAAGLTREQAIEASRHRLEVKRMQGQQGPWAFGSTMNVADVRYGPNIELVNAPRSGALWRFFKA